MKKYEFDAYSNSSFTFYKDGETFFGAYNPCESPFELGGIEDVENFLIGFAGEDADRD